MDSRAVGKGEIVADPLVKSRQELETEVLELRAKIASSWDVIGMCHHCCTSIYRRAGMVGEGDKNWHPMCKVAARAEAAEVARDRLANALHRIVSIPGGHFQALHEIAARALEAPALAYYFGCIAGHKPGHYLIDCHGRIVADPPHGLEPDKLDQKFAPQPRAELMRGRFKLTQILGWTFMGFWDNTGDTRPGSNSLFIMRGHMNAEQTMAAAASLFPGIWQRFKDWQFVESKP